MIILLLLSLYYIDQPYLGVPAHGEFDMELRFGPSGEIIGFFNVGIWDRFGFGISYGASNLIGAGNPEFYEMPGAQIRIIVIEGGYVVPEVILGFDNQGYGGYDSLRYEIMSKGIYCQIGKNFVLSNIKLVPSFGLNYCFEEDNRLDMFFGMETLFGEGFAVMLDYSPNLKDNQDQNKGYFNVGLKFIFYEELFFEFALRDLLDNSLNNQQFNRMIRLGYEQIF